MAHNGWKDGYWADPRAHYLIPKRLHQTKADPDARPDSVQRAMAKIAARKSLSVQAKNRLRAIVRYHDARTRGLCYQCKAGAVVLNYVWHGQVRYQQRMSLCWEHLQRRGLKPCYAVDGGGG